MLYVCDSSAGMLEYVWVMVGCRRLDSRLGTDRDIPVCSGIDLDFGNKYAVAAFWGVA